MLFMLKNLKRKSDAEYGCEQAVGGAYIRVNRTKRNLQEVSGEETLDSVAIRLYLVHRAKPSELDDSFNYI